MMQVCINLFVDQEGIPEREEGGDGNVQISTETMEMEKELVLVFILFEFFCKFY